MEQFSSNGIVIKSKPYKNCKLLTILTENKGVINAFSNGLSSTKSKLLVCSELFCYSFFKFTEKQDLIRIESGDPIEEFFDLRKDLKKLSLVSYFADITNDLAPKEEDAAEHLKLLLNSIDKLLKGSIPIDLIKSIYELRILSISGFMPDLTTTGDFKPLYLNSINNESVIKSIKYIIYSDVNLLFNFIINDESINSLNNFTERYLKEQLEREIPSLEFYKSIK